MKRVTSLPLRDFSNRSNTANNENIMLDRGKQCITNEKENAPLLSQEKELKMTKSSLRNNDRVHNTSLNVKDALIERVNQLNEIVANANAELLECKNQMQKNMKNQHEIRAFYQNQLKHITNHQEQREKVLQERVDKLEQENKYETWFNFSNSH